MIPFSSCNLLYLFDGFKLYLKEEGRKIKLHRMWLNRHLEEQHYLLGFFRTYL